MHDLLVQEEEEVSLRNLSPVSPTSAGARLEKFTFEERLELVSDFDGKPK